MLTSDRRRKKPLEVHRYQKGESTGQGITTADGGRKAVGHAQMLAMFGRGPRG